jgi:hypothetical protein
MLILWLISIPKDTALIRAIQHFRYGCKPLLSQDPKINKDIQDSINVLFDHLAQGWYVYGMCKLNPIKQLDLLVS